MLKNYDTAEKVNEELVLFHFSFYVEQFVVSVGVSGSSLLLCNLVAPFCINSPASSEQNTVVAR